MRIIFKNWKICRKIVKTLIIQNTIKLCGKIERNVNSKTI